MIDLRLGDCLELMRDLPDGSVDCVVTDPPYGIGQDKGMGGGGFDSSGKYKRRPRRYEGEWDSNAPDETTMLNIISIAPISIIWGGNYHKLPVGGKWLVWNKQQVMPSYSDAELAWTNIDGVKVDMFTLHCNKARQEQGLHPTQKPLALMMWCVEKFTNEGDTILDPFMGSGTTGVACVKLNRNFIGMEINKDYFDIAEQRIREAQQQLALPLPT